MKIDAVIKPNQKGQIVIPQKMREELGINADSNLNIFVKDQGLHIYQINEVVPKYPVLESPSKTNQSYIELLKSTQGSWRQMTTKEKKQEAERQKIELDEVKKSRKKW